jgi:hypothetical protein
MVTARLGAMTLLTIIGLSGCQSGESFQPDSASIVLRNDESTNVVVTACTDARCEHQAPTRERGLAPGDVLPVNLSTDDVPSYYRISEAKRTSRCLTLSLAENPANSVVPVSSARDCSIATEQGAAEWFSSVLAWILFIGIGVIGIASTAWIVMRTWMWLRGRVKVGWTLLMTIAVACVSLAGAWLVIDLVALGHRGFFWIRRWRAGTT